MFGSWDELTELVSEGERMLLLRIAAVTDTKDSSKTRFGERNALMKNKEG